MKLIKYLLLVLALLWVGFTWRRVIRLRLRPRTRHAQRSPSPPPVIEMVACAHCDVHLGRDVAVSGTQGRWYCGAEHRRVHEG